MGRLCKAPDTRHTQDQKTVSRFTVAVDRPKRQGEEQGADFIPCVAFGKLGEFTEKYLMKGTKVIVCGRIQTGSYKDRDGRTVYTTEVIADECDFAESLNR